MVSQTICRGLCGGVFYRIRVPVVSSVADDDGPRSRTNGS